ncbi:MAG: hypothetical protein HDQ88_03245 [Clostridia bacterium]|nr:hypothetical protein [Clostridia bacterium]
MIATIMGAMTDDIYHVRHVKVPNGMNERRTIVCGNDEEPILTALQHYKLFAAKKDILDVIGQILKEVELC